MTDGPRRPPRPPRGTGPSSPPPSPRPTRPARAAAPGPAAGATSGEAPRRKAPIPAAPGPRPDRPARRAPARPADRSGRPSGVTFKAPAPAAPKPPRRPEPSRTTPDRRADERETHTGRLRRIRANRPPVEELLPPAPAGGSFQQRYGIPYDTQGPKVRLAVLWAVAVTVSIAYQPLRPWGLAVLYGVVAGAAAAQVIDAHRGERPSVDRTVAAFGASALPVLATLGTRALGAGYVVLVVVAVAAAIARPERGRLPLARAGHGVGAAGLCGGAGASLVLLAEYEIGALIMLLVFVMVYDASDYVVGSGASNAIEGPLAGMLFIAAATAVFAVVGAPPFRGADIWTFSVLAMLACPAGQIVASALLPEARSHAPALRRLDALLLAGPAWAGLVGLYLVRAG